VVFIPGANHGHLPSFYALHAEDDLEEEKRVLYVAVTRARRFLHLMRPLMAPRAGGPVMAQPSPFLADGAVRACLEERITGRPPAAEAGADGDAARKGARLRRVLGSLR
jgi:DNA helicase-2/ATP-dependent DNA helicase PcrA